MQNKSDSILLMKQQKRYFGRYFSLLLRVGREDLHHSHICPLNLKDASGLALSTTKRVSIHVGDVPQEVVYRKNKDVCLSLCVD